MTFEADLKRHLQDDAALAAAVGDRIAPQPLGEGEGLPAITYTVPSDQPQTDLDGEDGALNRVVVQVDVWAKTAAGAKETGELVRVRMKTPAATFAAVPLSIFQDYEPETRRHRVTRDFSCWYRLS